MKLFFHIRISSEQHHFSSLITNLDNGIQYFDVDNFSDALTVNTALEALKHSEKLFLFVEVIENISLGGISKVLNSIAKLDIPFHIAYHGNHAMLDKMMSRFKSNMTTSLSTIAVPEVANQFFSK